MPRNFWPFSRINAKRRIKLKETENEQRLNSISRKSKRRANESRALHPLLSFHRILYNFWPFPRINPKERIELRRKKKKWTAINYDFSRNNFAQTSFLLSPFPRSLLHLSAISTIHLLLHDESLSIRFYYFTAICIISHTFVPFWGS